jgi:hypothetical protein
VNDFDAIRSREKPETTFGGFGRLPGGLMTIR